MSEESSSGMADPLEPLILDFLEWLERAPRSYAEVMSAWRTSCPRLPVWEEAGDRGFLDFAPREEGGSRVALSAQGRAHLRARRPRA